MTITQNGHSRKVTVDEALQHKTYQDAIAGSRLAQRAVIRMIERRELARAAKAPPRPRVIVKRAQPEPINADAALLLLDVTQIHTIDSAYPAAKLTTWAVEAALAHRRGGFSRKELDEARRHALAPGDIVWPQARES